MNVGEVKPVLRRRYPLGHRHGVFDLDTLFDEFFRWPALSPAWNFQDRVFGDFVPRVDVAETGKEITISADLPGMDEKDIKVEVEESVVTISGEKKEDREEKGKNWHRVERSSGSFARSVAVPSTVDLAKSKATFKKGVLSITLPKLAEEKESKKTLQISGE